MSNFAVSNERVVAPFAYANLWKFLFIDWGFTENYTQGPLIKPALFQIMAQCQTGDKPLPESIMHLLKHMPHTASMSQCIHQSVNQGPDSI